LTLVLEKTRSAPRRPDESVRDPNRVLRDICHAFGSAADAEEILASTVRWVRMALGSDATVRIAQPDAAGRLRVLWADGPETESGRKRAASRRVAFEAKRVMRVAIPWTDRELAYLPLVSRGTSVGVLELDAPAEAMAGGWEVVEAVASQAAISLGNMSERTRLRLEVEAADRVAKLGRDLVAARDIEAAVRMVIRFLGRRFRTPVAGWWAEEGEGESRFALVDVSGVGSRKRREVRQAMTDVPRWRAISVGDRDALKDQFASIVGAQRVSAHDADHAILLAGSATEQVDESLETVGALLEDVLQLLAITNQAKRRNEQLDMGIAWTAHELRGPLLGIRAVMELLIQRADTEPRDLALLHRSLRELDQLSGMAGGLLGWAVGARPLHRRRADLVRVVKAAVESCGLETGTEDGVLVLAPQRAMARIDPTHMRAAIGNLVRNAMIYSAPGTKIRVTVAGDEVGLKVSVKDRGPEIPPAEQASIFDPFVRGIRPARTQTGSGLGLFITRRIVEAHGGQVWVDSNPLGATFHILLPVDIREERRCES
jgi:signal transduction histidine kinase